MQYEWIGSKQPFLDQISLKSLGAIHIGCFGGSKSNGAFKNEDALFLMQEEDGSWIFTCLLDAHNSSESAEIIIELLKNNSNQIHKICSSETAFSDIEPYILSLFTEENFKSRCKDITGETSCLICYQSGAYLWWFSIGDCMAYLFHPDLAKFNQYGLNQRQFFEWVGQVNTFDLSVPCYTSGRRQLRYGSNYIVLATDGVLEYGDGYYQSSHNLYNSFIKGDRIDRNLQTILDNIMKDKVRDSASVVCWEVINKQQGLFPSD